MAFKVLKQLIPAPTGSDPSWAQRNVWVEKLTPDDTVDEYSLENDAIKKRDELTASDTTGRLYRVIES
jgi:hypothetical protein|tara:strand:- start:505 stop:708 length:204 start_codon:yes stop_codon:yes gene_type:complete